MREILFRGKRVDNGEWVEGNLFVPDKVTRLEAPTEILVGTNVVRISYEVDPETVGEYTGLTDKNGKRIFEGDILLYCGVQNVVVSFENGQFVINHYAINLLKARNAESEVVGDRYDNPELLEVQG